MTSVVENLVKSYFNDNRETLFGEQASFVRYQPRRHAINVRISEVDYQLALGCIVFRKMHGQKGENSNDTLLVKQFGTTNHELGPLPGFVTFALEVHFFQTVLPVLDQMTPTKQLFVKFCSSCTSATSTSNQAAILFEWPSRRAVDSFPFEAKSLLYRRCSMMLRKIAQFHARSLLLKRTQPDLFRDMNFACPSPGHFNIQLVLPMLTRCMEQLTQTHRYSRFAEGLSRFAQMLDNFDHRLKVPFARSFANEQCWVLCHQNYGQESVIFLPFVDKFLADLEIFNCQSMGFASLGVDMVIPLLVEPTASARAGNFELMVRDYHDELQQAGFDVVIPSVECIKTEIRSSVPFALYFLASRIIRANMESQSTNLLFRPNNWREEKLLQLCNYLITADLI